jgi:hypothetical protein
MYLGSDIIVKILNYRNDYLQEEKRQKQREKLLFAHIRNKYIHRITSERHSMLKKFEGLNYIGQKYKYFVTKRLYSTSYLKPYVKTYGPRQWYYNKYQSICGPFLLYLRRYSTDNTIGKFSKTTRIPKRYNGKKRYWKDYFY